MLLFALLPLRRFAVAEDGASRQFGNAFNGANLSPGVPGFPHELESRLRKVARETQFVARVGEVAPDLIKAFYRDLIMRQSWPYLPIAHKRPKRQLLPTKIVASLILFAPTSYRGMRRRGNPGSRSPCLHFVVDRPPANFAPCSGQHPLRKRCSGVERKVNGLFLYQLRRYSKADERLSGDGVESGNRMPMIIDARLITGIGI